MTSSGRAVKYRDVLAIPEFRGLWIALGQSAIGDQFARVALSVLVFARTGSPAFTGLAYALTFLPTVIGGVLLSGLADRLPRRNLLVGLDVGRALLLAAMALPRLPLWALFVLVVAAVVGTAPFSAGVGALLPDILPREDEYVVGAGLRTLTFQLAQVLGFAGGGIVVAAIGPRAALLVDAATFLASAGVIARSVRWRPPSGAHSVDGRPPRVLDTVRFVLRTPLLRTLVATGALSGLLVVPEGLAAPYAADKGSGAVAVGVLLTGLPAGSAVGAAVLARWIPADRRWSAMRAFVAVAGIPLILMFLQPSIPATLGLLVLVGAAGAYQVLASTLFVRAVPGEFRGAAVGFAGSVVVASQGVGVLGFGMIADLTGAGGAAGIAGLAATAMGMVLLVALRNASGSSRAIGASAPASG